jgi:hypothetical protein
VNQPPQQPGQPPQPPQQPGQPPAQQWPAQQWPAAPQQQWAGQPQQQWAGQPPQPPQQQWGPQQGWQQPAQQQPQYAPPRIPGPGIGTHLKRAIDWNVAEIVATPREKQQLEALGIEPRLHGLFVWRRSSLIVAMPLLLVGVVLAFVQAADVELSGFNGLGKLWVFLPAIGLVFVPLGALGSIRSWTELRRTSKALIVCWVLSLVLPLSAALIPLDYVTDIGRLEAAYGGSGVFALRLGLAVSFALTLLPVIVSVPGGVVKGAARVKSLFPSASLPGWFLVAVAPFYSLFMVIVFVLIDQLIGNGLLLLGVGLLAFAPWLYVVYRRVYGRPLSLAEARTELARASRFGGVITLGGMLLIIIFAFTRKVGGAHVLGSSDKDSIFTYIQVLRSLIEVLGRSIVTTVVFSSIFLTMILTDWRTMTEMRGEIKEEHDSQMRALQRYIDSPASQGQPTQVAPPAS